MITFVIDEDLRLVGKPPEGRGMNDPVTVPPEGIACRTDRLGVEPAAALRRIGGINCPFAPGFDRHRNSYLWRMILTENRYPLFGIMRGLTSLAGALNYPLGHLPIGSARKGTRMSTGITVSERAAKRIGEILKGEPAGAMLRVSVEGGGCSGFQYKFDVERAKAADDLVISRDNATVLIDPVSVNYMAGSEIDFVDDLIGASFKVKNPQAKASCGCGTSFAL
jgi:iron-sulfur cluster assembly accessory protein